MAERVDFNSVKISNAIKGAARWNRCEIKKVKFWSYCTAIGYKYNWELEEKSITVEEIQNIVERTLYWKRPKEIGNAYSIIEEKELRLEK